MTPSAHTEHAGKVIVLCVHKTLLLSQDQLTHTQKGQPIKADLIASCISSELATSAVIGQAKRYHTYHND